MNPAHTFYTTLTTTDPGLLNTLQTTALVTPLEEAPAYLQPHLNEEQRDSIDVARLWSLLRKNLRGSDLEGEDFSGMPLAHFDFEGANLRGASLHRATLTNASLRRCILTSANLEFADLTEAELGDADLTECTLRQARLTKAVCQGVTAHRIVGDHAFLEDSDWHAADLTGAQLVGVWAARASFVKARLHSANLSSALLQGAQLNRAMCQQSIFTLADLRQAQLNEADLFQCDFREAKLQGTDLRESRCVGAQFEGSWQVDPHTQIDVNNHALIGMALLSQAQTVAQRQFALYVQFQRGVCWDGFVNLLLRQPPEMVQWAKQALHAFESLRPTVESYANRVDERLKRRRHSLDVGWINLPLRDLLLAESEQQVALSNVELYWYLRGILSMAIRQPEMQIDEEQRRVVITLLKLFTHMDESEE